jgi:hypothetical protein
MSRRVLLGLVLGAVLSMVVGAGLEADRAYDFGRQATPRLMSVPASTLEQLGVRLNPANPPLYCAPVSLAAQYGLPPASVAGCPLQRSSAVAAASEWVPGTAREAVLTWLALRRDPASSGERLVWAIVMQSGKSTAGKLVTAGCGIVSSRTGSYLCGAMGRPDQLVFVDAQTAEFVTSLPLARWGQPTGRVRTPGRPLTD